MKTKNRFWRRYCSAIEKDLIWNKPNESKLVSMASVSSRLIIVQWQVLIS